MDLQVHKFAPHGFCANCYAVKSGDDIALIDVGVATAEIVEYVKQNSSKIKYILLTHDHFDHICGVEDVLKHCNAKVCIHALDESGLYDSSYSLCSRVGFAQPNIRADIALSDGDTLDFGGSKILVLHTPGHTDGSVCYLFDNLLFSGDTLFFESVGRTDFITGSSTELSKSLTRLVSLSGIDKVYCGHGDNTTLEHERKHNFFINYEGIY